MNRKNNKIRQSAKGEECQLRIYPYCSGSTETVVLCHMPTGAGGMGMKSPDWWSSYGCNVCHDIVDGRRRSGLTQHEILQCMYGGVYRTLSLLIDKGVVHVSGWN